MNNTNEALSFEEQEKQYNEDRLYSSQANTVLTKIKAIKKHLAEQRWIWELLQNASDYNESVDVKISLNSDCLVFEHNGNPFKYKDAMNLIVPDSDKNRVNEKGHQELETVGQFGTGFISTHILSLKIKVKGEILGKENTCKPFEFILNRQEKHDKKAIMRSMGEAENELKKWRSREAIPYIPGFKTSFKYFFSHPFNSDINCTDIANAGLNQLDLLLPYVLAFVPKIKRITILDNVNGNHKKYEIHARNNINPSITDINIYLNKGEQSFQSVNYLLVKQGDTTISWQYSQEGGNKSLIELNTLVPRLFFSFPLVGSQKFCFPTIINNSNKNEWIPRTEREGVDLTEKDEAGIKNRLVIENAGKAYLKLIKYVTEEEWDNLHLLTKIPFFNFEDEQIKDWFKKDVWEDIRKELLNSKIVQTKNGRIKLSNLLLPCYDINDESSADTLQNLYSLISKFDKKHDGFNLSIKERLPLFNESSDLVKFWTDTLDFRKFPKLKYTWEDLIKDVSEEKNYRLLDEKIEGNGWDWLNELINNLKVLKFNFKTIEPIFPNQEEEGIFCNQETLYSDKNILLGVADKNFLKDLLVLTGRNIRKDLISEKINVLVVDDDERYLTIEDNLAKPINDFVSNGSFENRKSIVLQIIACLPTEVDKNNRLSIFELARAFFGEEIPKSTVASGIPSKIWWGADRLLLSHLADKINGSSLDLLKEDILHLKEGETTLKWHQTFIELIAVEKYRKLLEGKALLPNQSQEGNFISTDKLFIDNNLQIPLKDALLKFGDKYDWRKILLHKDYSTYFPDGDVRKLFFGERFKDNKKAGERINYILQNKEKDDYKSASILEGTFHLIKYIFGTEKIEDQKRKQLWEFASNLFEQIEATEKEYISNIQWGEIEQTVLYQIAEKVANIGSQSVEENEKDSLLFLKEHLNKEKEDELNERKWLQALINFFEKNDKDLTNQFAILPNRKGDFCLANDLKNSYDKVEGEKTEGVAPENLLIALGKIARAKLEDWNEIVLHKEFSFQLNDSVTTRIIAHHIEGLLNDRRGYDENEVIQEGVLLIKEFIDSLGENERSSIFPVLHRDIYKMALTGMGERAKYASNISAELLKNLSENPDIKEKLELVKNISKDTVAKIVNTPNLIARIEKTSNVSEADLEGLSLNREAYILQEAAKINGQQQNGQSGITVSFSRSDFVPNPNQTNDYHKQLGRWGELYINSILTKQQETGEINSFIWLNEERETGGNHDFEIIKISNSQKIYMDVKATEKDATQPVYITGNQWQKIFKEKENYLIYRVYNADIENEPENNGTAAFYEHEPFKHFLKHMEERILELCKKSVTNSIKADIVKKLL